MKQPIPKVKFSMRQCLPAKTPIIVVLIAILALLLPQSVLTKKLYKYKNDNGAWVFTDKPPASNVEAEVKPLPVSKLPTKVSFRNRGTKEAPMLVAINDYHGPIEVEVSAQLRNMRAKPPLPRRVVLPARKETTIVALTPVGRGGWRYAYKMGAVLGDPASKHRPQQPYAPPFAPGQRFYIGQAFNGAFSHNHPQSRHAVDISLPLGTPVRAARGGIVMDVAGDFFDGGTDPKYKSRANAVRILHSDGTMAVYAHLHPDSIRVTSGKRVKRGTWIANSGNTGFSTGPHLHFVIQKNKGMELVSVPFKFVDADGRGMTPVAGQWLVAY